MPRRGAVIGVGLAWIILAVAASTRAAEPAALKKITTVEGITEYRLENGLKVLLFPDLSKPTITVNLTVFVGSRHEGYGETGMAHLLEHMLFKGTPTHQNIPKLLTSRGAQYNGTTWLDRTNYYETLPAKGDHLEFAIRLEADRMVNSIIKAEDLASEMTVVRNEFERGENSPFYVLAQRMMSVAFEWHNYGKATIGNRADIERVPIENLRAFYRKFYQPDNALLVVAGNFKADEALRLIGKYFGAIPRQKRQLDNTYTEEPPQDGERFVTLRRVGNAGVVGVLYHIPAGAHPDYPSIDVLESVLTAAPAGLLYKSLVESKKAASVSGVAFSLHDPGVLRLMARATTGNEPQVVLDTVLQTLEDVCQKGVTDAEVERAKRRLLSQFERAAADSRRIAIQLSEWAAQGDWRLLFLYRDNVEKVTAASVSAVAAKYLQRNNRTIGMFIPTKEPQRVTVPPTPNLTALIGDYKGRKAIASGEAFEVSPQNIDARTIRFKLPSGIDTAVVEKRTRGQLVNVRLTLRYGDEQNLKRLGKACEFLPRLMVRGTKRSTRQQLQDQLDKLQATLVASGDAGKMTFTIQVRRENLPAMLELLQEALREPILPEDELAILKRSQVSAIEQQLTNPAALASNAVRRVLNPYPEDDPRHVATLEEELALVQALTRTDLTRLYDEYVGAAHGQLTIVGDVNAEQTLPIVKSLLSDWEPAQSYARLKRRNADVKGRRQTILTPGKESAFYFAATAIPMRDDHPDYPAMVIGNFILGSGSLSSRLADRVRQKEGLSYSIGSGLQVLSLDHRTAFYIYASCKPENIVRVRQAIREEIDRLLKQGVSEQELNNAKQGYLQQQQLARTTDAGLASILESSLVAGRTMQFTANVEDKIRELTPQQIGDALRKHIDPNRLFIVEAGDFSKTASKPKPGKKPAGGKGP